MVKYDYLVAGSGLFGSTFAEHMVRAGKKVLVVERRDHIGGNCYTEDRDGIQIHRYGPHIFNTNDKRLWDYVRRFAEFNHFSYRPKAVHGDKVYSFPINLLTFYQLWGTSTPAEVHAKLASVRVDIPNPKSMEEWLLANVGREVYETFFYGYTTKQWRMTPDKIPASIVRRLPLRFTYDDNYYNSRYQGIPIGGYTQIFEKMLDGVEVKLNTPVEDDWRKYAKKLVYTGRIDELLKFKYGELPYLTLNFEHKKIDGDYQGIAGINYTSEDVPFTRCIEHKHFEFLDKPYSWITHEYPIDWKEGAEPFYPIPWERDTYDLYLKEIPEDILIGGRLGKYLYQNMDVTCASAMKFVQKELGCLPS